MFLLKIATAAGLAAVVAAQVVNQTLCNGKNYTYQELAGFGLIPGDARDKFGDTIGGIGSAIALDNLNGSNCPMEATRVSCGLCQTEDGRILRLLSI